MEREPGYEEVFIKSLMKPLRIRILAPEDMELLESVPEADRAGDLMLHGIYDCEEFMAKLAAVVGSELVGMMMDSRTRPLLFRLRTIKAELLEAIYRVNRLRRVGFRDGEGILFDNRTLLFRVDGSGRLLVSDRDPE